MANFRKEMFPDYKATRDHRTKVVLHIYFVAGGFSVVGIDQKRMEQIYYLSVNSPHHKREDGLAAWHGAKYVVENILQGYRVDRVKVDKGFHESNNVELI